MNEAIISAGVTLLVCLINNHYQQKRFEEQQQVAAKETDRKHEETMGMVSYKLEQLTKRVEEHNKVVERMYKAENQLELQDEKIKVANHRIDDLEKGRN